jgi:hypothetical protein
MRRRVGAHLPAVAVWVGFVTWFLCHVAEWPSHVPLQVGWTGKVTAWGSPWLALGLVAGLGFFFIGLTVLLDELWARQESRKRFNVLSLLDEFVLSLMVGIQGSLLIASASEPSVYRISWEVSLLVVGGAVLLGVLAELKRPYQASPDRPVVDSHPTEAFRKHLMERVKAGERVVFWDVQNPRYVPWLSIGVPLVLWVSAGFLIGESVWPAMLNGVIGLLLLFFYGGQRTRVSRDGITIRYGLTGIRIFRCRFAEITDIRIRSFAPLADFGGYGIRAKRGITAYFLAGGEGVQLNLLNRRSALIGSSNPKRLASAIEAVGGVPLVSNSEVTS